MRDSRFPRGTCTAPGNVTLFPLLALAHVHEQRVAQIARCSGVDLADLVLRLLEEFPVTEHGYTNDSNANRHPGYLGERNVDAPPDRPRRGRRGRRRRRIGRRRHPRHAADARAADGAEGAAAARQDAAHAGRGPDPRGVQCVAARNHPDDGAARSRVPEGRSRPALSRHRPLLGRLHRRRPDRAATGEEGRRRHAVAGPGRQHPPSRVPDRLPDVPAARERSAAGEGLAPPGRRPPALGAQGLQPGGAAVAERLRAAGRGRGLVLRQGQPQRVVLASGPAGAPVPEVPVGAVLPRSHARLDGPARGGDRAVPEGGRHGSRALRSARAQRSS